MGRALAVFAFASALVAWLSWSRAEVGVGDAHSGSPAAERERIRAEQAAARVSESDAAAVRSTQAPSASNAWNGVSALTVPKDSVDHVQLRGRVVDSTGAPPRAENGRLVLRREGAELQIKFAKAGTFDQQRVPSGTWNARVEARLPEWKLRAALAGTDGSEIVREIVVTSATRELVLH